MEPLAGPSSGPYDYDLLVIGGSSGGLALAQEASRFRRKVLVLDSQRAPGGSSLSVDHLRRFFQVSSLLGLSLKDSLEYGWKVPAGVVHRWEDLVQNATTQIQSQASDLRREMKRSGIFFLNAHGRITAPHTVQATDSGGVRRTLTAETLVLATGEQPQRLGVPGEVEHCITRDALLALPGPPGRTLVVGGASEALEVAGFLSGLGQPVSVLLQNAVLPGADRKMADRIENYMLVGGVNFIYHCSVTEVQQTMETLSGGQSQRRLQVSLTDREGLTRQELFDTVVVAVGREACLDQLGLESVGLQRCHHGRILTNDSDQTSVDHIYAIGPIQHGRPSSPGLSVHCGTLLARRLYGGDLVLCDYSLVPAVVLTPLEYAACGLTEEDATLTFGEDNIEVYHSYYWPLEWVLPARNKNSCYVKAVCHLPDQQRVVGLHIMGPNAGDVLQGFTAAMKCGLTKPQLDATVGIHPGSAQVLTSLTQTQRMSEALLLRGNC